MPFAFAIGQLWQQCDLLRTGAAATLTTICSIAMAAFGRLTCAEIDHFARHGIKYGFLLPKLRHLPAPRFCLAGVVLSLYPQSADTHHDRIMNPTAAVVTPVCSLAPRFVLALRCAEGRAVIKKARDKLRAVLIHDCEAVHILPSEGLLNLTTLGILGAQ
jgi:hypothetical protein